MVYYFCYFAAVVNLSFGAWALTQEDVWNATSHICVGVGLVLLGGLSRRIDRGNFEGDRLLKRILKSQKQAADDKRFKV